ncbi:hypothetical protein PR202_ga09049 [Eleusine coracana subsp. coracana]|uniref:Bowman-Birk serine protease inhibitors family domain-containing protein n=1 Tax=Eleusine coracana subsp. coracana TaxID=191504 RepID=A0AAV5C395_ELECO|nr:hypothetical protein QOZ80_1AG0039850 [Eleusine coracana subsp. coracana]GJM92569.1 hypothetical protein PR202_ga09049 [Eleusine coracana subsp. coracana]
MKTQALLITLALVLAAALPLAESQAGGRRGKAAKGLCCDNCGACNRKLPPDCLCNDTSPRGCHPACKTCDKFTDSDGAALFQCKDWITNFCQRRCTPAA